MVNKVEKDGLHCKTKAAARFEVWVKFWEEGALTRKAAVAPSQSRSNPIFRGNRVDNIFGAG